MAFSTSNIQVSYSPPLKIMFGDWSGNVGDAAGTISVGGNYIGSLWFKNDAATSANAAATQIFPVVQWNGLIPGALTIQNTDNVGTGSFIIFTRGQ